MTGPSPQAKNSLVPVSTASLQCGQFTPNISIPLLHLPLCRVSVFMAILVSVSANHEIGLHILHSSAIRRGVCASMTLHRTAVVSAMPCSHQANVN